MGLFGSPRRIYIDYTINIADPVLAGQLQAQKSIFAAPANSDPLASTWTEQPFAAGTFGLAPIDLGNVVGAQDDETHGFVFGSPEKASLKFQVQILTSSQQFSSPSITSPWITDAAGPGQRIDTLKDWFQPDLNVPDAPDNDDIWIWRGTFVYAAPTLVPDVSGGTATRGTVSQCRFLNGFEHPLQGGGGSGNLQGQFTRAASRHADGYGCEIRGIAGVQYGKYLHTTHEHYGAAVAESWERIYIRPVALPNADATFWRARATSDPDLGMKLKMMPTGAIKVVSVDAAGTETQITTFTGPVLGKFGKLDIVMKMSGLSIYFNAVQKVTSAFYAFGGTTHESSEIGADSDMGDSGLGLDLDDWINNEPPDVLQLVAGKTVTPAPDWAGGTKIRRVDVESFDTDFAGFTGDPRALPQTPAVLGNATLTSSTSGALLSCKTNSKAALDDEVGAAGCCAFVVSKFGIVAAAEVTGKLGYAIAGGADVDTVISETNVASTWSNVLYHPDGMVTCAPVSPIRLKYTKATTTNLATVQALVCQAALCGTFGDEDVIPPASGPVPKAKTNNTGIHNSPYPRTPWAIAGLPPLSPVMFFAGSYVGNGVGLDLAFESLICAIFVRRANAGTGVEGAWWFTSTTANHKGVRFVLNPEFASLVEQDPDDALDPSVVQSHVPCTLRIAGGSQATNNNGDTYEYVAIADPGMRFFLNADLAYPFGATDRQTALVNTNFLAEAILGFKEDESTSASTAAFLKGIGHGTQELSNFNAAVTGSALAISRGSLLSRAALHFAGAGSTAIALMLMRRADGNNDPGQNAVVQLATYVGDGTNGRNIPLLNPCGKRPLFAIVVPHDNSGAWFRDPAHTTTHSTQSPATDGTTGIVGGDIDTIIVNAGANANGVAYDVLVFPGSDVAGNGGFSGNGTFEPVQPALPKDGPFKGSPGFDTTGVVLPPGSSGGDTGGVAGGEDFGTQCVAASTRVINVALAHIGVTDQVADVVNDATMQATVARLHYQDDVEAALRDFPWPFATGYATLVLSAGSPDAPVNRDWIYAYLAPDDMVYARRLVRDGVGRRFDPDPIAFRVGKSLVAGVSVAILYTNEADAVLEYTFRPSCAASAGDALFRDALAWRLAASLAPGLARNKVTAADAYSMYNSKLSIAARAAAAEAQPRTPFGDGDADWIRGRR